MTAQKDLPYFADFHERMAYVLEVLRENKNSFAKRIGVNPTIVTNMIGGRLNKPSIDTIEKISKAYPKLNLIWLIMGQGLPFIESRAELATEDAVRELPPFSLAGEPSSEPYQASTDAACWPRLIEAQQRIIALQDQLLKLQTPNLNIPQNA